MANPKLAWIGYRPTHKSYVPYVKAIGQAAVAWSGLHEALRDLFWILLGADKPTASTLWYSIRSDRSQRAMLKDLAKNEHLLGNISKDILDKIESLLGQCNSLATTRDDVVHAPLLSADNRGVYPNAWSGSPMATRLLNKDLLIEYKWCRDACMVLADYTIQIYTHLMTEADPGFPLPGKLKLPNRGQKKTHPSQRRQPPAKQPPRQRKA